MVRTKRILASIIVSIFISVTVLAQSKLHFDLDYQYSLGMSENSQDILITEAHIRWVATYCKFQHVMMLRQDGQLALAWD